MKKIILVFGVLLCGIMNAQLKFGVNAGFLSGEAKAKTVFGESSQSGNGFYAGAFSEVNVFGKLAVRPSVNYTRLKDSDGLLIPIMVKYFVFSGLNVQAGPQFLIDLSSEPDIQIGSGYNKTNVGLGFGLGYDFLDKFSAEARYSIQLNDHMKDATSNNTIKANYFNIGIAYKLK